MAQQRTVLVTGGAGFIGSHLCDALVASGLTVRCFDNLATGNRANVEHHAGSDRFTFIEGDLRAPASVNSAVAGADAVLHLAALGSVPRSIDDPLPSEAANLGGFLNVLEACRHNGNVKLVYASSSSVYGDSKQLPKREGQEGRPLSPYAVTKLMDEQYAWLYRHMFKLPVIGLRFFNVFGERQDPNGAYAAAIPKFILRLLKHQAPQVHGDGRQSRDFTYVGNAVAAMVAGMQCDREEAFGQVFNVACGERTELLDIVTLLRDGLAAQDPAIASVPIEHVPERPGDVRDSLAETSLAEHVLGFKAPFDLKQGMERAIPWYQAHWS
ncbi:MAG: SDR family NAD(P)-dependent oxidoreductase [Flavobacteriales bacterium]|nr:MAG: SDR family NAD(P)-dependent oxidoreductase [Flavobacteriales bacterium]